MKRFQDKNIIISGAASGIGRACAERIASEGGHLGLIDIDERGLMETAALVEKHNIRIFYKTCDVSSFKETADCVSYLVTQLGSLQVLSHNAGIMRCYHTHEMLIEQWQEIISVNVTGTFNMNRHCLPYLLESESSAIVNNASIAADHRHPWMAAYAASKGAVKSFTRSLFIEYCMQGLRANCVMPGSISSNMSRSFMMPERADKTLLKSLIPFGESRLVHARHAANAIAFLASSDAAHINGTEITVDGGRIF